jgi:superfamily II RNA helicase
VKTCIFTDIYKHDGNSLRVLHGHEYTQAAGRAGRLGLDTVGHVIHLNNIFRTVDNLSYKTMMNGQPQSLVSKFKISYNLLLNLVDNGDNNIVNFAKRSMITGDLDAQLKEIYYKISTLSMELDKTKLCSNNLRTPSNVIEEYINLQRNKLSAVNKKRKEIERSIAYIQDNYKFIENDKNVYKNIYIKENEINELQSQYNNINSYIQSGVDSVLRLLVDEKYLENKKNVDETTEITTLSLTTIGKFATHLREIHCLIFSKLIDNNILFSLSSKQLVALFSCFTNITVQDDFKDIVPSTDDLLLKETVIKVSTMYDEYAEKEEKYSINSGTDYTIHYDLLNYTSKWCDCENIVDCKLLLQQLEREKRIFLGEFVKGMLKINNISTEMEKIAELTGNIAFLSKLKEIPQLTLKYVVTNQSLYV